MLTEARKHLPEVDLAEADMRTLNLEATFDTVVCLFSSIGYMAGVGELDQAVAAMAAHLEPGGILIVDGWIRPDAWHDPGMTHVEVAGSDDTRVVRAGRSRREGDTTHLEMHHLIATVDGIEHIVKHHHLTLFARDQYEAAFRHAGLTVETIDSPMPGRDRYLGRRPA
jgi:SAM-dependent methyltransferase